MCIQPTNKQAAFANMYSKTLMVILIFTTAFSPDFLFRVINYLYENLFGCKILIYFLQMQILQYRQIVINDRSFFLHIVLFPILLMIILLKFNDPKSFYVMFKFFR